MPTPSTPVLTSFTGADEEPLSEGGAWTGGTIRTASATIKPCRRVGNQLGPSSIGGANTAESVYNTSFAADQEAFATLATIATANFQDVYCRVQGEGNTATAKAYFCGYDGSLNGGSGAVYIYKLVAGVFTQLGSNVNVTLASLDKICIQAIGTAIAGYYFHGGVWNTSANIQATDSAISGSGKLGVDLSCAGAFRMDEFGGGAIDLGQPLASIMIRSHN